MNVDLAVVGSRFLDLTFEGLPRVPRPGEELVARALHATPGGTGAQAVALARLGVSVALVAPLGAGFGADRLVSVFEAEGVQLRGYRTNEAGTVTALLHTPEGVAMASVVGVDEPTADDVAGVGASSVVASLGRLRLVPEDATVHAVTGALEVCRIDTARLEPLARSRTFIANGPKRPP